MGSISKALVAGVGGALAGPAGVPFMLGYLTPYALTIGLPAVLTYLAPKNQLYARLKYEFAKPPACNDLPASAGRFRKT